MTMDAQGATTADLSDRVDTVGWGVLLVVIGVVSLLPGMPEGAWLVAAGVVMLGASWVRARMRLSVHGVTVIVGIVALAAGAFVVVGLSTEVGPLVLIVLGLTIVVGALQRARHSDAVPLAPVR
jgi:hypothetical protein